MGILWCEESERDAEKHMVSSRVSYLNERNTAKSNNAIFQLSPQDFFPTKYLGKGMRSSTILVFPLKLKSQKYALKTMFSSWLTEPYLLFNSEAVRKLQEQNHHLVEVKLYMQNRDKLYVFMVEMREGDLYFHLSKKIPQNNRYFSQKVIKRISIEVILALEELHSKGIIYRNLRPQNIFVTKEGYLQFSQYLFSVEGHKVTSNYCGSAEYTPPEVYTDLENGYSYPLDVWMLGILLFELAFKATPFEKGNGDSDNSQKEPLDKASQIQHRILNLSLRDVLVDRKHDYSEEFMDLLQKLLTSDPRVRPELETVKQHPFYKDCDWKQVSKLYFQSLLTLLPQDSVRFRDGKDPLKVPSRTLIRLGTHPAIPLQQGCHFVAEELLLEE